MTGPFPPKQSVVGTPISILTFDRVRQILESPRQDRATVVAVCNVHSVMSARRDRGLAEALKAADVATPDGMPLVWGLRAMGHSQEERVYGPEIMRRSILNPDSKLTHFLFGATEETLTRLQASVREQNPSVQIAGAIAPPFRPLTEGEEDAIIDEIRASGATVLWVGLGMPKQELWMHRMTQRLPGMTILGVGAAFDFLAGTKREAPNWMRSHGLEWLYRLIQEPRRLWRRYLWNNPAFLVLLGAQWVGHRLRSNG